ncbi:MAG: PEP-CTERM sorting domain-containing protein, partial [Armatimonadota bacterium]
EEEPTMMVAAEPPEELTPVTRVAPLQYLLVPSLLGAVGALGGGGGGGTVVPEPSSLLVLGIGGAGMFITCRKRLASAIGRKSGTRNE